MEHIVKNWHEAAQLLGEITRNDYTLGSGYNYPRLFAAFYKDAWSGEGMGYRVYKTKDNKLGTFIATITINEKG